MTYGRQMVRLAAAMIAMIIAYAAPSVAQAHEGHAHHEPATIEVHVVSYETVMQAPIAPADQAILPSIEPASTVPTFGDSSLGRPLASADWGVEAGAATGSIKAGAAGKGCCPGACRGSCCGTMACHGSGILSGPSSLPARAFGHVKLVPSNVAVVSGIGPEALPKPPRPLA
jgi:hypothetical protein